MSAAYENFQSFALPYWTGTTQAATGATTLVSAPGAGLRIAVDGLRVVITTDTTLRIPFNFYENTTTAGMFYGNQSATNGGVVPLSMDLTTPWLLQTNASLGFVIGAMASTPGCAIEIRYRSVTGR